MEPIKKRRNSILKKKTSDEDTTTEIKARRISFSGKKSVKEFIAGEEAETIWGTSYEESADDLKVSSCESGLVNVHVKRIQLRNRRVICEPQQQKRRSSLKKKILIAENDKENVCVIPNPPAVEIAPEAKSSLPLVRIELPQSKSLVKSEHAMGHTIEENVSKSQEAMPPKKLVVDCSSICSSTFDFINFSAQINKTITIEQSLDVSLNESELQMFKFRVPVTATEISPNTSNVLCRSILMSEEDVNVLKMMRKQKGNINVIEEQTKDEELKLIETKKRDGGVTDMTMMNVEDTIIQSEKSVKIFAGTSSQPSDISHIHDGKGSKRKSEKTPHSFVLDSSLVEINSPLRKKPMHTLHSSSMNDTNKQIGNSSQNEVNRRPTIYEAVAVDESICNHTQKPNGRATIHFDSVGVEECAVGMHSISETNTLSHTIFDSKTINDTSSFPNTTASCLAMGNQTNSMDLSIAIPKVQKNSQANGQTIYFTPDIQMEYSLAGGQSVHMNAENSQTIYNSSNIEEMAVPATNNIQKQRKSIYTPLNMDEESPKPTKTLKSNNSKGLKLRQTIHTTEEIIADIPREIDPIPVLQKTIITPINIFEDSIQVKSNTVVIKKQRHTIYDPVEIKEDINPAQQRIVYSNKNNKKRESIYTPTEMIEVSPKSNETRASSTLSGLKERQINFDPEDIVEDIPTTNVLQKTNKAPVDIFEDSVDLGTTSKSSAKNNQTIFASDEINVDPLSYQSSIPLNKQNKARESIYTPSEMIEDSPKCTLPSEAQSKPKIPPGEVKKRLTILTPEDIIEDYPKELTSKSVFQRTIEIEEPIHSLSRIPQVNSYKPSESVCSASDMFEEPSSFLAPQTSEGSKSSKCLTKRQTILIPENIVDDSIKEIESEDVLQKTNKILINMFEHSLNSELASKLRVENEGIKCQELSNECTDIELISEPIHIANFSSKSNKVRESIYTPSDMIEDSPKVMQTTRAEAESYNLKKSRTILNQEDITDDISKELPSKSGLTRTNNFSNEKIAKNRHTIYDSADIEEVTVTKGISYSNNTSNQVTKYRKTIYDAVDIEEATCAVKPGNALIEMNISSKAVQIPSDMVQNNSMCSDFHKQKTTFKDVKPCQSIFIPQDIIEDNIKEIESKNLLQKTIQIPFSIFEDSLQEDHALKQVVKGRQTIYDVADIEEDNVHIQDATSVSLIKNQNQRKSINISSEIVLDDLEEPKLIQENTTVSKAPVQSYCPKSNVKRQTTYNQMDISIDCNTNPQISADIEVKKNQKEQATINIPSKKVEDQPNVIKQRPPSKIQVFRRESSSTDLTAKKSLQLQTGEIQQNVAGNSNQLKTQPKFSFAVHQANLKKRQSIHTPVDMVEDSPKAMKPIQSSKSNSIARKTVYAPCDIPPDSPKSAPVEKIHQQTIKSDADIVIDYNVTSNDKFLDKQKRQTVHTCLEMTVDSPKLTGVYKEAVELEEKPARPLENKSKIQEIDVQPRKPTDLPFRKPTKLFSETYKSLENPYSSTKSLMDKVMQEMGYSMNFQLQFPPDQEKHQEPSKSKNINSQEELYPTMNLSAAQDAYNRTVSLDNTMELSIARDTNSKKDQQQTVCLSESIKMEEENNIRCESSKLYKTSSDDSLMELSVHDAGINQKIHSQRNIEISENLSNAVNIVNKKQLTQFNDESIKNKPSKQVNLMVTHYSYKPELDNQKSQHFDLEVEEINQNQTTANCEKSQDMRLQQSSFKLPLPQTKLIHQDIEIENIDDQLESSSQVPKAQIHKNACRKTIHCNEDLEVEYLQPSSVASVNQQTIDRIELNKENVSQKENRRKTLHLNEDLEIEAMYDQSDTSAKGPPPRFNRQTMNLNENIEQVENQQQSSKTQNLLQVRKQHKRQTILMNQDLDLCEVDDSVKISPQIPLQESIKSIQRTYHEENQEVCSQNIPQKANRQTIIFNQNLDLCEIDDDLQQLSPQMPLKDSIKSNRRLSPQMPLIDSIKSNRRTNYLNQDLEVIERQENGSQVIPQRPDRKTIYLNQDLALCDSPKLPSQTSSRDSIKINNLNLPVAKSHEIITQDILRRPNRQTIHFNQDLDSSEIDDLPPRISSQASVKTKRKTNHINQDGDMDECREVDNQVIPPNGQTILVSQELDMNISSEEQSIPLNEAQSVKRISQEIGRRTIYFQQELEIEDQDDTCEKSTNKQQLIPDQHRNKPSLHQTSEFEEEHVTQKKLFNETKKNTEENACRFPFTDNLDLDRKTVTNTRNCQTINCTSNNDLGESVVPAAGDENMMNPSMPNKNCLKEEKELSAKQVSKPRRVTICDSQALDMDESLLPKSTARKSSFSRTLNFDEVSTKLETSRQKSTSLSKSKVIRQSTFNDEESPIYNPNLRPICPMTPSEVDKSLAEYLKVEAAIEDQEEEIFYDAEDGTENEKQVKRQTCHVPLNIFEESGMQPLQLDVLKRKTTFSPRSMTNESLDHDQFKLGARETNDDLSILQNETRQNVPDKRIQKQTLDISRNELFQKSIVSKDVMEVTQMQDSINNVKQILMKPRLEINFDENSSKTNVQKLRQTLHLSESINIADVSPAWKPSSAVQSVNELLLENTRLFSQSNLMNPSAFEKKRCTLFFTGNEDSMDVSCIESGPADPESTPTKNKVSRIPQLIGSAKKLESLKKSMEFIQQELPNIGCHLRNNQKCEDIDNTSKDQETPRRYSTSIPKKLKELEESVDVIELSPKAISPAANKTAETTQKVVRQLQESFDTIDIPRKVLSSVRKKAEKSPRKNASELEEPYETDENPRRTINVSPRALQESFDTVEIPRRGTTFQRNDTLYIFPNEKETTINASQKSLFHLEDPPITISDVSTFFSQKLLPNAKQALATYSPNTTEALCKLNVNEIQALSRSPDSQDTTQNLAHFKKRYVDLTCDSVDLCDSRDNIEKTHLSLVNTFDDESEMVHSPPEIQKIIVESVPPPKQQPVKPNSSVCRKCKCQRLSITQNDTTIGSFILEPLPVYKVDLSELEQLAKKPNISDVGKVWRQKIRESDSFNVSDGSRSMAMDDEDSESIEKLLMELAEERLTNAQNRQQKRKEIKIENSFLYKVRRKMQSKSNWIINHLLLFNNIIMLTHTRVRTFAILINFTPKDPRGVEVIFNDIQLKPNILHTRQWKPIEYAMHYQLLVELPFDLKKICPTSDHFFDLLEHVEKVTEDVLRIGKEMLSLVLPSPASLIREPSGRLYIRKYVRTKTPQNDVKRTEIHIEVRNIKKLSYESIAMPPLYEFDEKIQLLPVGNDFLRKFLNDPLKFIKT